MFIVWISPVIDKEIGYSVTPCSKNNLISRGGRWKKGINTVHAIPKNIHDYRGFEIDVYFDLKKNSFLAFHDSSDKLRESIEPILQRLVQIKYKGSIWLDFKNLEAHNSLTALRHLINLTQLYQLQSRIIVESKNPELLQTFSYYGYYTSYYVPYFNPFLMKKNERNRVTAEIAEKLKKYPTSALSGYYFQYPLLRAKFPGMPILTWTENPRWSLVNHLFQKKIRKDTSLVAIIEY